MSLALNDPVRVKVSLNQLTISVGCAVNLDVGQLENILIIILFNLF